ncbi:MAG: MOSC domain-containing protein [Desulfobacca sp.]|uniref:MOSC domain-containing protein n=1 Tax=Desulfobacca sp. TaxID=2067990 RepID=UPI00404AB120
MTKNDKVSWSQGRVVAVSVSATTGVRKENVPEAMVKVNHGLEGDAHAGAWHRQVSLLAQESIDKMRQRGLELHPGDFAENITTAGLDIPHLPVGTRLRLGGAVELEVTQIGKACHHGCAIRQAVGDCVMPREGIFARVLQGGIVRPDDPIEVIHVPGWDPDL